MQIIGDGFDEFFPEALLQVPDAASNNGRKAVKKRGRTKAVGEDPVPEHVVADVPDPACFSDGEPSDAGSLLSLSLPGASEAEAEAGARQQQHKQQHR